MRFNRLSSLVLIVVLLAAATSLMSAQDDERPELVVIRREGLHPEGIEWDAENGRFLVGSFTEGTVFEIADDGTITPFIEDEDLITSLGIHIDQETGRLLVTNSEVAEEPEATGKAQLGIYDLNTGERLHLVDLGSLVEGGRHLANDVTSDPEGNAYVTDSLSPVIYKVTPDGEASIFAESEEFASETFGLNGIEYHPDGYLLVARSEPGALYKIPLDDPKAITQVALDEAFSPDGILLHPNGNLMVVAITFNEDGSSNSEVLEIASDDHWESAAIVQRAPTNPDFSASTITLREGTPYVIYSHFNELFTGQSVAEFEIARIDFQP